MPSSILKAGEFAMNEAAMHRKIAFAGIGEAKRSTTAVRNALDLAVEASLAALTDAGLASHDVDGVLTASPAGDPHFMFSTLVVEALGIPAHINTTLQSAGASPCLALLYAARAIMSGACHTVLVCESDSRGTRFKGDKIQAMRAARPWTDDYEDPVGLTVPGKYALIAQRHMHRFGMRPEDLAAVAVAARTHAQRQATAPKRDPLTVKAVLASPFVAAPLRALDCCPVLDWGGAVIVTTTERARNMRKPPVLLLGAGEGHGPYHPHEMPELPSPATRASGEAAFAMAGVRPQDVDVAEVFDAFTIAALIAIEELGFCEPGQAGTLFASGATALGGAVPTNTTGGMLTWGNAHIIVVPEAVRQVRGEAGVNQVPNVELALAHGIGGPMAASCTLVLGK
jgi:acetyl-CoA acetyltransferase